ncbi:MAG TPA: MarR family transcriptional regulator [Acidimicrobiia bacterium]|nr:MarR family transcriptional regulator [Acidimicrobiia bacterium]
MKSKDTASDGKPEARQDPIAEAKRQWIRHGWGDAAEGMAAVTTIVRVNQIVTSRVADALTPWGLSFARFEILRLLGFSRRGQLPMGKIGERLQVHPASVTSAVKRLERDGLVAREVDGLDSRIVLASITEAGRVVLAPATEAINTVFETVAGHHDLASMVKSLDVIRASAGDPVEAVSPMVDDRSL